MPVVVFYMYLNGHLHTHAYLLPDVYVVYIIFFYNTQVIKQ